jgi:hypothetical protein
MYAGRIFGSIVLKADKTCSLPGLIEFNCDVGHKLFKNEFY